MTLEELLWERAGLVEGAHTLHAVLKWCEAADYLDKFPTTVEVAEFHGKTERQAWRWRARCRHVFNEDEFQRVVLDVVKSMRRQRKPNPLKATVTLAA